MAAYARHDVVRHTELMQEPILLCEGGPMAASRNHSTASSNERPWNSVLNERAMVSSSRRRGLAPPSIRSALGPSVAKYPPSHHVYMLQSISES